MLSLYLDQKFLPISSVRTSTAFMTRQDAYELKSASYRVVSEIFSNEFARDVHIEIFPRFLDRLLADILEGVGCFFAVLILTSTFSDLRNPQVEKTQVLWQDREQNSCRQCRRKAGSPRPLEKK